MALVFWVSVGVNYRLLVRFVFQFDIQCVMFLPAIVLIVVRICYTKILHLQLRPIKFTDKWIFNVHLYKNYVLVKGEKL